MKPDHNEAMALATEILPAGAGHGDATRSEVRGDGVTTTVSKRPATPKYSFRTVVECPAEGCGCMDTKVVSKPEPWFRWRKCVKCKGRFKEIGEKV